MGITERPRTAFLEGLRNTFDFEPPTEHGLDTVHAIEAMYEGSAKVFFALGGNFLSATPDTYHTAQALQSCDLTVHVSTKLNRSHLVCGTEALILPCYGRTDIDLKNYVEQFVTVENSMGIVHPSRGHVHPQGDIKSEIEIVCGIAKELLPERQPLFSEFEIDYRKIREKIETVVGGFEDFNSRLESEGEMTLYHPVRDDLKFNTPSGRAEFSSVAINGITPGTDELVMMTVRSHDQFNTTIYGLDDRYRGVYSGRKVVLMNSKDMISRELKQGDLVDIESRYGDKTRSVTRFKVLAYDIPAGCIATYFPEANPLIPIHEFAVKSHTPASKSIIVKVEKHES